MFNTSSALPIIFISVYKFIDIFFNVKRSKMVWNGIRPVFDDFYYRAKRVKK